MNLKFSPIITLLLPVFSLAQITGKAIVIDDGDTFILLTPQQKEITIRLYGIDSPEYGQAFGEAAKENLARLIFNKNVQVINKDLDQYGRIVGIVVYSNRNINELMIQQGYAWHYRQYDENPVWEKDELNARKLRKGLWAGSNPVAPWNWRHNGNR